MSERLIDVSPSLPSPPAGEPPAPARVSVVPAGAGVRLSADEWNARYPVGTRMLHRWGLAVWLHRPFEQVTVESEAWECGGGLLVYISGRPNPAFAEELEPIDAD